VFERVATALAQLIARLRAASRGVHPHEVTRALNEDDATHLSGGGSDDDAGGVARRARAAAEAARRARSKHD
jgi:hypothetical protein